MVKRWWLVDPRGDVLTLATLAAAGVCECSGPLNCVFTDKTLTLASFSGEEAESWPRKFDNGLIRRVGGPKLCLE